MNRRQIILISILINCGLLALLFLTAVKNENDFQANPEMQTLAEIALPDSSNSFASHGNASESFYAEALPVDEVDHVLKAYLPEMPVETIYAEEAKSFDSKTTMTPEIVVDESKPIKTVEVIVKRGDALDKIARANQTTVSQIRKLNGLVSDKLKIGQTLKVPVGTAKAKEVEPSKVKTPLIADAAKDPVFYTVKSGDNPWKIAKQYSVKFEDLLKLNSLDEERAKNLKIGDKIRVR